MKATNQHPSINAPSLDPETLKAIYPEQVRLLYAAIPFNIAATLFGAGMLAYIEWSFINHDTVIVWLAAFFLIVVMRAALAIAYKRSKNPSTPFWGRAVTASILIAGMIWGMAVIVLFPDNIISQLLLTVIIMGVAAGGVSSLSYLLNSSIGFASLLMVPLITRLLYADHEYAVILAVLSLVFYVAILISALRFYKQISENIALSHKSINDTVAVRLAMEQAERANAAKSMFLSSMSHELRTPMNAIMGFAQIMKIDARNPLTPSQEYHVNEIMSASEHLLSLIDDVLDLSQIESGEFVTTLTKTSIGDIVKESASFVNHMAQKKQVNISIQDDLNNKFVRADSTRLKQVLVNLLRNAIEYNRENGKVAINGVSDGENFILSIIDTGKGINPSDQDDLFKPFHRLDETNNVVGAGLGLTLSKHLMESMSGEIGFESELGKGSRVWISLPLAS